MGLGRTVGLRAIAVLIVGVTIGAVAALVLRQVTVTSQTDPCFGFGTLVSTRAYTVTEEGAENAKTIGLDLTVGEEREVRECQLSPAERVTIDGSTGMTLSHTYTVDEAIAYYQQHPEQQPVEELRKAAEQAKQAEFVPLVTGAVQPLLVGGCDPGWPSQEFPQEGVRLCFPPDWNVDDSIAHRVLVTNDKITLNVHATDGGGALDCTQPATVETTGGVVHICAMKPQFGGQSHHLLLPNGVKLFLFVSDDASSEERAAAFRVAMSVETLP